MNAPAEPICGGGGWIVGMGYSIPGEPSEYFPDGSTSILGCNQLKCRRCGEWVRHFDNLYVRATVLGSNDAEQLYLSTDPFAHRLAEHDKDSRAYVCRCSFAQTATASTVEGLDDSDWRCAGHPPRDGFAFPQFNEPNSLDDGRAWTARFESFDQRNDNVYYTIRMVENGAVTGTFIGRVSYVGDTQDDAQIRASFESFLKQIAASGKTNTDYAGSDHP